MRHHRYNSNSFAPFGNLLEDFFNKSIGDIVGGDISANTPAVNTYETDEAYVLEVAAPGISKDEIQIEVEKDYLIVSADIERSGNQPKFKRKEFDYGKFSRRFHLKDDIDTSKIKASYALGVLKIHLPKLDTESVNHKTKITID